MSVAVHLHSIIQPHAHRETLAEKVLLAVHATKPLSLQREIEALTPQQLKDLLDEIVLDLQPKELDRLAAMIPLETLEAAVRAQYPEHVNALQTAKEMLQEAKYYLATTECKASPTLKAHLASILNALISILESFLTAFGIANFFKAPENAMDAEFKSQKIMMLLSLFAMLSGILLPLLGPTFGASVIGGVLLSLSALSLIYPFFKPQASRLPMGENWTGQLQQGTLFVVDGRKKTLDEIARALIAGKQTKTHAMLLGKTGIGKTATARAFVQAVERGDYPELLGKQIFYFNTADLFGGTEMFSYANKIFAQISEAMGRHRENFILIFDEIHMACQKTEQGALSDQLKTFLDPGVDNFPYVIGITTEEEYYQEIYANNAAFARRFQRIVIENTDELETVKILSNAFLKQSPATLLEPNALRTLLRKTKEAFGETLQQPATSLKILSQCINRTTATQASVLEKRVEEIRDRIQALYAQDAGQLPYGRKKLAPALEAKLGELEAELNAARKSLERLFKNRDRLLEIKRAALKKVVDTENSTADAQQLNAFLLQSHFQARLLEDKIRREANRLNIKITIDSPLIEAVIAETQESERRVQEAVARGREQIAIRAI